MRRLFQLLVLILVIGVAESHAACSNTDLSNGWVCIISVNAPGTGFTAPTSGAINTTGANMLVAAYAPYGGAAANTFTDSKTNTWTACSTQQTTSAGSSWLLYAKNPTVGSGHTFSSSVAGASLTVIAVSGADTSSPCDQQNGATAEGDTLSPGSITPGAGSALVVAALGYHPVTGSVPTGILINASMTVLDGTAAGYGDHLGVYIATITQSSVAAIAPTWSWTAANGGMDAGANIADFKSGSGGSSTSHSLPLTGVGR